MRVGTRHDQADDCTQDHGLSNAHLDGRQARVTQNEDNDRNDRHQSEQHVRLFNESDLLGFVNRGVSIGFALVTEDDGHGEDTDDTDTVDHPVIGEVVSDEVHDFHAGDLGDVHVVSGAWRANATVRTHHHGSCSSSRLNTGAEHHRDQRGTDSCGHAGSGRDSHVDDHRDSRTNRNQEDAQATDRLGEHLDQVLVALGERTNISKTHRGADCHDETAGGHGLSECIESTHRSHGHAAENETGRKENQTRFVALDQGVDRQDDDSHGDPV